MGELNSWMLRVEPITCFDHFSFVDYDENIVNESYPNTGNFTSLLKFSSKFAMNSSAIKPESALPIAVPSRWK